MGDDALLALEFGALSLAVYQAAGEEFAAFARRAALEPLDQAAPLLDSRRLQVEEICRAFGVPSSLLVGPRL